MNRILAALAPLAVALPAVANAGELQWNHRDTKTKEAIVRVMDQCVDKQPEAPFVEGPNGTMALGETKQLPSKNAGGFSLSGPDKDGNMKYSFELNSLAVWSIDEGGRGAQVVRSASPIGMRDPEIDCFLANINQTLPKGATVQTFDQRITHDALGGLWVGGAPVGTHHLVIDDPKREKQAARQLAKKD